MTWQNIALSLTQTKKQTKNKFLVSARVALSIGANTKKKHR